MHATAQDESFNRAFVLFLHSLRPNDSAARSFQIGSTVTRHRQARLVKQVLQLVMAPQLPVRSLGRQGLKASAQGLGIITGSCMCVTFLSMTSLLVVYCMGMSTAYKDIATPVTDDESIAVIHEALQLGVTFLDTSDVYGPFTNEELVGEVVLLISVIELLLRCE